MTTTQLIGVLTLVGTLLVAGIQLGRSQQKIEELDRRISNLERVHQYMYGSFAVPEGVDR